MSASYDHAFGKGKKLLNGVGPVGQQIIGGWRLAAIANYFAGFPLAMTRGCHAFDCDRMACVSSRSSYLHRTGCSAYNPQNASQTDI